MRMKVYEKGQIVIPAEIRRRLQIRAGDELDVTLDDATGTVVLRRDTPAPADEVAGSLASYAEGKDFPSHREMAESLRKGLARGASTD